MEPPLSATDMVCGLNLETALLTRRDWLLPDNDQPAQLLRELEGGLSNSSFLLQVGREHLVLRLEAASACHLRLDRMNEVAVQTSAARVGIAAQLIYACPEQGLLVTRYLPGVICAVRQVENRSFVKSLARLLKQVHTLDAPRAILNPAQKADYYWAELDKHPASTLHQLEGLRGPMDELMLKVWQQNLAKCCCHNDLVVENILCSHGQLFLLDWEYAALGDPYFDLAALVLNFNMNALQTRQLLVAYEGTLQAKSEQRLLSGQAIYLYLELLWYQLQGRVTNSSQFLARAEQRQLRLTKLLCSKIS